MTIDEDFLDKSYAPTLVRSTVDSGIRFSIPYQGEYQDNGKADALSTSEYQKYTIKAQLKVAETVPPDTEIEFSIPANDKWAVSYFEGNSPDEVLDSRKDGSMVVVGTSVKVRKIGTDNTLSELTVGIGNETFPPFIATEDTPIATTLTCNYEKADAITEVALTPTLSDEKYAKAYIAAGSTAPDPATATPVASGTEVKIALEEGVRVVTILVKAETGDTKTYTITIVDKYVALSSLDIQVGTKTDGVIKKGLREGVLFAPDTLAYTVDVPGDYAESDTGVTITPTIAEGHDIQTTVTLSGTNCSLANNSVASESSFQVTDIKSNAELTLTVTASDNTTTKVYTITFQVWSVDTGDISVRVQGENKPYNSDEDKAKEKNIDYYFLLTDEIECKGKFLITAQDGIPVQICAYLSDTPEAYDESKVYGAGTYYIILTAEAGNTKTYVAVLTQQEYLELVEDSIYDFLLEESIDEDGDIYLYRRTYKEKSVLHGFEQKDVRIVLGQIKPETSVNAFIQNIIPSQRNIVRLYTNKNVLIYNEGKPGEDITEEELNSSEDYRISTSWYLQFGGTEEAPLETIYLSVLGDVNCDGYVDARDITRINQNIKEVVKFDALEVRLAAYVSNKGYISAFDISETNKLIKEVKKIEDYYYKPKVQEDA